MFKKKREKNKTGIPHLTFVSLEFFLAISYCLKTIVFNVYLFLSML